MNSWKRRDGIENSSKVYTSSVPMLYRGQTDIKKGREIDMKNKTAFLEGCR